MPREQYLESLKAQQHMSKEELERMENHIQESLRRAGASPAAISSDAVTYMAHFLYETRLAPSDYSMTIIHRSVAWCMEAMNG